MLVPLTRPIENSPRQNFPGRLARTSVNNIIVPWPSGTHAPKPAQGPGVDSLLSTRARPSQSLFHERSYSHGEMIIVEVAICVGVACCLKASRLALL